MTRRTRSRSARSPRTRRSVASRAATRRLRLAFSSSTLAGSASSCRLSSPSLPFAWSQAPSIFAGLRRPLIFLRRRVQGALEWLSTLGRPSRLLPVKTLGIALA